MTGATGGGGYETDETSEAGYTGTMRNRTERDELRGTR